MIQKKWYPIFKKGRYINPVINKKRESIFFETMPSLLKSFISRLHKGTLGLEWMQSDMVQMRSFSPLITWIGHATFLIQVQNKNILTDPVFGNIAFLFKRYLPSGIQLSLLPPIDYILISHNHWDHMDLASLFQLKSRNPQMKLLVPAGNALWFEKRGFLVSEYSWWEKVTFDDITFSFLPSVHWSGRGLFDQNKTLWGSWMITERLTQTKIYFGGDSAFGDHFIQIAEEFKNIDVALLPIGPCEPSDWMQRMHMNSIQAIQAFKILQASKMIPMHWGTFPFGTEASIEPIRKLQNEVRKRCLDTTSVICLKVGQQFLYIKKIVQIESIKNLEK